MKIFNHTENRLELIESVRLLPQVAALFSLKYNASKEWADSDGRDRTRFYGEIQYVYYMHSRTSPFKSYTDEEREAKAIAIASARKWAEFEELDGLSTAKQKVKKQPTWKISKELQEFIDLAKELEDNTEAKRTLRSVRGLLQSMRKHLDSVDFSLETEDGKPKYDITKYLAIADKIPASIDRIKELEEKCDAEDNLESTRIRGGAKKGRREDHRNLVESNV